ncbi:hypothetical protein C9374_001939 [Naegleria lovaniensis]|uniref:Uncharacterized protein n=1 Tax=Naegleria lovaniensis TaxID=51637 RepID=A0AA88KMF1_NAELO|nr:uncharacterized protein C9374_001939 [Naegleria lovaniensis]KAG2386904.1 hypothetical protein C9374_001939 [Naegleria lovaniensis]
MLIGTSSPPRLTSINTTSMSDHSTLIQHSPTTTTGRGSTQDLLQELQDLHQSVLVYLHHNYGVIPSTVTVINDHTNSNTRSPLSKVSITSSTSTNKNQFSSSVSSYSTSAVSSSPKNHPPVSKQRSFILLEDDCVSSPRHTSSISFGDEIPNSSPNSSGFSPLSRGSKMSNSMNSISLTNTSPTSMNSHSTSSSLNCTECETRMVRLERLIYQVLNLILRGEYKPKLNISSNKSSPSQPQTHSSSEPETPRKMVQSRVKSAHLMNVEPLKEMIASVVQYEPKRCTMGYEILLELKSEVACLSQIL